MNKDVLEAYSKGGLTTLLRDHSASLPHVGLIEKTEDRKHIEDVAHYMGSLANGKIDEVVDLPADDRACLVKIAAVSGEERDFLMYTALYHDIGKAAIRPRHGAVGADIILQTEFEDRKKFYALGFSRRQIYLMSNLIRFHDYLAALGTGETSYLAFAEVLCPVSNMALVNDESSENFLNYLLLINIADVAGSLHRRIDRETSMAIMHDFGLISQAHGDISRKVYGECELGRENTLSDMRVIHQQSLAARNLGHVLSELKRISEDNSTERLRRLLRAGYLRALQGVSDLNDYRRWVAGKYSDEAKEPKPIENWFLRDDRSNDVMPIAASLNAINVKQKFYENFAFICKLDYELGFVSELLRSMIIEEVNNRRKSPHDFRRDLAMTLVTFVNTLGELFGDFTQNDTRIGLGFERLKEIQSPYKEEILRRLSGEEGTFKQTEALTAFKSSVNLWLI